MIHIRRIYKKPSFDFYIMLISNIVLLILLILKLFNFSNNKNIIDQHSLLFYLIGFACNLYIMISIVYGFIKNGAYIIINGNFLDFPQSEDVIRFDDIDTLELRDINGTKMILIRKKGEDKCTLISQEFIFSDVSKLYVELKIRKGVS